MPFETDALNPAPLPTASLGRPRPLTGLPTDTTSNTFSDAWNVRIDREIKAVASGLKEIVDLADIGKDPSPHAHTVQALHMKLRTASLIRSAQNLRDMAHELKLLLTLSDEVETARGRDIEARTVREEVEGLRARVGQEVVGLLRDKDGERET